LLVLHLDEDGTQRRLTDTLFDVSHATPLKCDLARGRRHRPSGAVRGDDHPITGLVVDADQIVDVPMEWRGLPFEPCDAPHLQTCVVEDLRGAGARIGWREVPGRRLQEQRQEGSQKSAHVRLC
jgi:hypothetical protein